MGMTSRLGCPQKGNANMSQDYFKCLVCQKFFDTLFKIEKHIQIHYHEPDKITEAMSSGGVRRRGMLPIEKVTFIECLVPVVKNQIDPDFLAQYSEVQAKEEHEDVKSELDVKPEILVGRKRGPRLNLGPVEVLEPRRSRLQAAINIRKTAAAILTVPEPDDDITPEQNEDMEFLQNLIVRLSDSDDEDFRPSDYDGQKFFPPTQRKVGRPVGSVRTLKTRKATRPSITKSTARKSKKKKESTSLGGYKCDHCDKVYSMRNYLNAHLYEAHKDIVKMILCPFSTCNKPYHSFFALRGHLKNHTESERKENFLLEKLSQLRASEDFPSSQDQEKSTPATLLDERTNRQCKFCLEICQTFRELNYHMSKKHEDDTEKLKCPCCSHYSEDVLSFVGHVKADHSEYLDPFKERLQVKEKERLLEKPYKCTKCDAAHRCQSQLDVHMAYHARMEARIAQENSDPERKFVCPVCQRRFKHKDNLRRHFTLHMENNPYVCNFPNCNKKFNSDYNMRRHKLLHNGQRRDSMRVRCPLCDASFCRKDKLPQHFRDAHKPEDMENLDAVKRKRRSLNAKCPRLSRYTVIREETELTATVNSESSSSATSTIPDPVVKSEPTSYSTTEEIHLTDRIILDADGIADHIKGETLRPEVTELTAAVLPPPPQPAAEPPLPPSDIEYMPSHLSKLIVADPVFKRIRKEDPKKVKDVIRSNYNLFGQGTFNCDICGSVYRRAWSLHFHLKTMHNKTLLDQTQKSGASQESSAQNANVTLLCGTCAYPAKDAQDLAKHVKSSHEMKIYCELCGIPCSTRAKLVKHVEEIHYSTVSRKFKCKYCAAAFTRESYLIFHEKRVHENSEKSEKKVCPVPGCGKMLAPSSYTGHMWRHKKSKVERAKAQCRLCGDYLSCAMALRRHIDAIHLGKPINRGRRGEPKGLASKGIVRRGPRTAGDEWFLPLLTQLKPTANANTHDDDDADNEPPHVVNTTPTNDSTDGAKNNEEEEHTSILGF